MSNKLELRGVHVFEKVVTPSGAAMVKLVRTNPYLRFQHDAQILYIQGGKVFSAEGGPVKEKDIPAWFAEEINKASKAALQECGWARKE
jgi:hypothetical protein